MTGDAPALSFVLTAHDEVAHIAGTLRHLGRQTGIVGGFEIVLIDDRSTDGTAAAAAAAGVPQLRILKAQPDPALPLTTRQQALDLAFRTARGRIILVVDADSAMTPGWAARMAAPILECRVDVVAGPIGFQATGGWLAAWQTADAHYYFAVARLLNALGVSGGVFFGNFAFRADVYDRIGGFAEIGFALTEDLAMAQAIHAAGFRTRYLSADTRVDVRAVTGFRALVARTLRISAGGFSILALILALWPLSLLFLLLAAILAPSPALLALLGLRYVAGATLVLLALGRHPSLRARLAALYHEPFTFLLSGAVLRRLAAGRRVDWGGQVYHRQRTEP